MLRRVLRADVQRRMFEFGGSGRVTPQLHHMPNSHPCDRDVLNRGERKAYIAAVQCLQSLPAKTPASTAAGAKTRFDDFVAVHIAQTPFIHYTGTFLSWHRYYLFLYEKALQTECGYTGTQPVCSNGACSRQLLTHLYQYWDWADTAISGLENSPIFDGSDTSMSGNGEYIPNRLDIIVGGGALARPPVILPPGTGGGCVISGPFKNMTVNLGPMALDEPGSVVASNPAGPLAYNPRCLKRDLTTEVNKRYSNATAILSTIRTPDIDAFQLALQGPPDSDNIGPHGGGHYALGGDPGRDFFASPGDPVFYLHHAMIDRVWWMWQMLSLDRQAGLGAVAGTNTFLNDPPSANTSIYDYIDVGYAGGPPTKIMDLLSTVAGPFCYVYV